MKYLFTIFWLMLVCAFLDQSSACEPNLQTDAESNKPHWIWIEKERTQDVVGHFRKDFAVTKQITSATIRAVGESASLAIYLDGKLIGEVEPYDALFQLDVTDSIRFGRQLLAIRSVSCAGPAAIFLVLDLKFDDDTRQQIVSNTSWLTSTKPAMHWQESVDFASDWKPAVSFGAARETLSIPPERQIDIKPIDNYEQWKQALGAEQGVDPASFLLAENFQIELIRSAQKDEDSWVSMAFDPQGRLVIAKEKKGLLRMTLSKDGNNVTGVESINESLKECRGVLFALDDLFVNANNSKGLYRLHDSNHDDQFDEVTSLYASAGGVGHGRNDLVLGPDKAIYTIHGDSVDLPKDCLDLTSPFRRARQGEKTSEGHVLRIDPDTRQVQLIAAGLRNPFGIDFNRDGEMFTYDADAEFDMGAPWYRPTRVVHVVPGGDFGWRGVTGSWPPYFPDHPDNAPPIIDIGKGSPTAIKFGTKSNFPSEYRSALFVLDWAYGRILSVHLSPRGASYLCTAETFLKGRPLNVTDLDFAPDGSMYIVTGGRATQSALYRIQFTGEEKRETKLTLQEEAREQFAQESRGLRRQLESRLQHSERESISNNWPHLSDPDPWIRHAARNLLERQPLESWQELALQESSLEAALASLLALARSQHAESYAEILNRLNRLTLDEASRSQKLTAIYTYALCLEEIAAEPALFDSELLADVAKRLNALYPQREYLVNQPLSMLLVKLGSNDAVSKTIELLKSATSQAEQLHYLFVLRNVRQGWTPESRQSYFAVLSQSKNYLRGEGMAGFLQKIREESVATLSPSERESLAAWLDQLDEDSQAVQTDADTVARPFVQKWRVDHALEDVKNIGGEPDLAAGALLFSAAACAKCHRLGGTGTLIGPDLTLVSSRFSRRDLLESIIEPSKVIPEKYQSVQVETVGGNVYVGRVVPSGDFRSPSLRLATDPRQPLQIIEIAKSDIESEQPAVVSWMPEGLLDTFTAEQIRDLLAYIESGGQTTAPD
jgi:putative heme-binding domain-containing protein